MHPQTLFDAQTLAHLQSVRTTTHSRLASNLRAYVTRALNDGAQPASDPCNQPIPSLRATVAPLAVITRLLEDSSDAEWQQFKADALTRLRQHCAASWCMVTDIDLAADIMAGALGYDVLFDFLTQEERDACRAKLVAEAKRLADAADGGVMHGGWWVDDLLNNHNW